LERQEIGLSKKRRFISKLLYKIIHVFLYPLKNINIDAVKQLHQVQIEKKTVSNISILLNISVIFLNALIFY